MSHLYHGELLKPILVGGSNHLEKYESQWEGLSHILWKIKFMFQTTNQLTIDLKKSPSPSLHPAWFPQAELAPSPHPTSQSP